MRKLFVIAFLALCACGKKIDSKEIWVEGSNIKIVKADGTEDYSGEMSEQIIFAFLKSLIQKCGLLIITKTATRKCLSNKLLIVLKKDLRKSTLGWIAI